MGLFALHLVLALLWTFLSGTPSLASFGVGSLLGFALLAAAKPLFPRSGYVRRVLGFIGFAAVFLRELLRSNLLLARAVLFQPIRTLRPDFVTYDIRDLSRTEVLILAQCLTLTPGTTTVDIAEDFGVLVAHVFDASDPEAVRAGIDRNLKRPLLRFTR